MMLHSKKLAMIMVVGLLMAGLVVGQIHHAAAQGESSYDKAEAALKAAAAASAQAQKQLNAAMAKMDSMKNMQMTSTEKEMMATMHDMAMTMKMLMEENKKLMEAIRNLIDLGKK